MKNTLSDRLNYLTTLAEEQSITRAAARLFISQPALTAFLKRTEEELGVRLFDRSTTPIRITKAGAYYLSELEKICVMQDRLHQELSDFSSHDPELRINIGIGRNRGSI
ncbi:LysR family transcriptional regulator [uncultured Gemmiger sp.]|uniref:LysR family transcriptional regulator n=1 Tax=uncultured Gemmiger sp. TaxID=1623490 RepID=UPI00266D9E7B|nr:LysR family transcriptional regulator [uncultured Gemmiger sp.]